MDTNSLKHILDFPNENGIVIFILGLLFVLSIYHFLLYFQHKDKSYLYYSIYTALIFASHLDEVEHGFISVLVKPFVDFLTRIDHDIVLTYNLLYFIFAFTFLDLKAYSLKWYKFIFRSVYILFILVVFVELLYTTTGNIQMLSMGNNVLIILISTLAIIGYIPLFKINNPLKYYIIIGSVTLFITSITATVFHKFNLTPDTEINYSIFYIGIVIENICFSLGLGQKQKLILEEKNKSQAELIIKLRENDQLRDVVQIQLEKNVASLNKKAKAEKLEKLKEKYDRELAELKVTSLRSQMNPHFVFNSLNAIKLYIINNEKENAVFYLNKFSKLIRRILNASQDKETSLADEIETTNLYVNIENIRFNNKIDYILTIDKALNLNTKKIPSLILQPFIENAIWHGLSAKKGNKEIKLNIEKGAKENLVITITDNGIGRKRSGEIKEKKIHKKNSLGLKLTEERLKNFIKENNYTYTLNIEDLYDKDGLASGTKVTLIINY